MSDAQQPKTSREQEHAPGGSASSSCSPFDLLREILNTDRNAVQELQALSPSYQPDRAMMDLHRRIDACLDTEPTSPPQIKFKMTESKKSAIWSLVYRVAVNHTMEREEFFDRMERYLACDDTGEPLVIEQEDRSP